MKNLNQFLLGATTAFALVLAFSFSQKTATPQPETDAAKKPHRIIFQLTTPDTAAYRALARQLGNVLAHWPTAQLEVVCHNKGIAFLQKEKTNVQPEIAGLKGRGVTFLACENTLKQQKIEKSQIIGEAGFVPVGLAEIVEKQEAGWAYIKSGF